MKRTAEVVFASSLLLTACGREALHADGEPASEDIPVATAPVTTAVEATCLLEFDPSAPFYFSDDELTEAGDVRIPIEEVTTEALTPFLEPIQQHIQPEHRAAGPNALTDDFSCEFGVFNGMAVTNYEDLTYIDVIVHEDSEPIPSEMLESVVTHENAHIYLFNLERMAQDDPELNDLLSNYEVTWVQLMMTLSPEVTEAVEGWLATGGTLDELYSAIAHAAPRNEYGLIIEPDAGPLAVLDESSYFGVNSGHPHTDKHELFASTLNLAIRYPEALMQASRSQGEADEYLTKQAIRETLELFAKYSAQGSDAAYAEFPEDFLEYVYS